MILGRVFSGTIEHTCPVNVGMNKKKQQKYWNATRFGCHLVGLIPEKLVSRRFIIKHFVRRCSLALHFVFSYENCDQMFEKLDFCFVKRKCILPSIKPIANQTIIPFKVKFNQLSTNKKSTDCFKGTDDKLVKAETGMKLNSLTLF